MNGDYSSRSRLENILKKRDSVGYRIEGRDAAAEYTGDGKLTIEKREDVFVKDSVIEECRINDYNIVIRL